MTPRSKGQGRSCVSSSWYVFFTNVYYYIDSIRPPPFTTTWQQCHVALVRPITPQRHPAHNNERQHLFLLQVQRVFFSFRYYSIYKYFITFSLLFMKWNLFNKWNPSASALYVAWYSNLYTGISDSARQCQQTWWSYSIKWQSLITTI